MHELDGVICYPAELTRATQQSDRCKKESRPGVRGLARLINVIGVVLCEIDCRKCWELLLGALQRSFVQLLKDAPSRRADVEAEQGPRSVHWVAAPNISVFISDHDYAAFEAEGLLESVECRPGVVARNWRALAAEASAGGSM